MYYTLFIWLVIKQDFGMPPFKERYLNVVHYGDRPDAAGPQPDKTKENQIVSDWNRMLEKQDVYYVNGDSMHTLRQGQPFQDAADLKSFLKDNLLCHALTPDEKSAYDMMRQHQATPEGLAAEKKLNALTEFSFIHCHQGGLPHATDFSLRAARTDAMRERIAVSKPNVRVDFTASPEGLKISEENTYTKWQERMGSTERVHRSTDKGKPFYAQTNSTYLITPDTKNIELLELKINCPSENLAPIFNKLDENKQATQGRFSTLMMKIGLKNVPKADSSPEEGHAYFYKDGQEFDSNADTAPPSVASGSDSGLEDDASRDEGPSSSKYQ
jgi:hypothetical protein